MSNLMAQFIPGIISAITGDRSARAQYRIGAEANKIEGSNLQFQKDVFRYNQRLQSDIFNREDTAIQRRVKDLEAAGLSPVLAAGQGARAGAPISVTAPQQGTQGKMMQMAAMGEFADISKTAAETMLLMTQADKNRASTGKDIAETGRIYVMTEAELNRIDIQNKALVASTEAQIRKINSDIEAQSYRNATEEERRINLAKQNEFLELSMPARVEATYQYVQANNIDISRKELENGLRKLEVGRYEMFHSWMISKTSQMGYLYSPEALAVISADLANGKDAALLSQLKKDLKEHYEDRPYSGQRSDISGIIFDALNKIFGGSRGAGQGQDKVIAPGIIFPKTQ